MPEWQRWKNIMKAYPFEERRLNKWEPPYIVQPKYNGVRCRAVPLQTVDPRNPMDRQYMLLSSEENPIYSVPHINMELSRLKLTAELDGELYTHGMSFEHITSITSRTVHPHEDAHKMRYWLFDVIPDEPLSQMKRSLILENLRGLSPLIRVAPFYLCENLEQIMKAYDAIIKEGYEGIIVRHCGAPYERKRSTWVMKFKPKKEDRYEITGFTEEVDKYGTPKDTLGALTCKSGDGNTFNVGTGFSTERRKQIWEGRDLITGNFAVVKYQHLTAKRKVPMFPVFVEVEAK